MDNQTDIGKLVWEDDADEVTSYLKHRAYGALKTYLVRQDMDKLGFEQPVFAVTYTRGDFKGFDTILYKGKCVKAAKDACQLHESIQELRV